MGKKIKTIFIMLLFCIFTTGCEIETSDMENINIYTTTYPINYLINSLYGEHSKVFSIYPTGVDLSTYKISNRKLEEYSKSDLFIFNSLDKDQKYAVKMINNNEKLKVIDAATGMDYNNSIEELWLNPYNYLMLAENIKEGLSEYIENPYLVEEINEKFDELDYNISKIDANLTESIKGAKYNTIVTDNEVFRYLEKYGLKVICLQDNEISINKVAEVKNLIATNQIKYVYTLNDKTNRTINSIIAETNVELIRINGMYSVDGEITNSNDDYFTVMKNNISQIEKELYK